MNKVKFRKTAKAHCRLCYSQPEKEKEMVIFPGSWRGGKYYLCQACASIVKDDLNSLSLDTTVTKSDTPVAEDLSTI